MRFCLLLLVCPALLGATLYLTPAEGAGIHDHQCDRIHTTTSQLLSANGSFPLLRGQLDVSLPFPAYYINENTNKYLRQRMEKTFGLVWNLRRVPARHKHEVVSLHLRTIRHTYLQGDPFVFVVEDKISPLLMYVSRSNSIPG